MKREPLMLGMVCRIAFRGDFDVDEAIERVEYAYKAIVSRRPYRQLYVKQFWYSVFEEDPDGLPGIVEIWMAKIPGKSGFLALESFLHSIIEPMNELEAIDIQRAYGF